MESNTDHPCCSAKIINFTMYTVLFKDVTEQPIKTTLVKLYKPIKNYAQTLTVVVILVVTSFGFWVITRHHGVGEVPG